MDIVYTTLRPAGLLGRFVEELWYTRGQVAYQRETIAPTGSAVAALVLGPTILLTPHSSRPPTPAARLRGEHRPFRAVSSFLLGPHDRPVTTEPTGETHCLGLVTTPVGCAVALHTPPAAIRGRVVNLLAAWPGAAAVRRQVEALTDPDEMLAVLERGLTEYLAPPGHGVDRCERAVALLQRDPTTPIGDVARTVGISAGHLDREFGRIVGLAPGTLAGIFRVRALLERLDVFGTPAWAARAAQLGWTDEFRLARDVQRHTGLTPAQHAAARHDLAEVEPSRS